MSRIISSSGMAFLPKSKPARGSQHRRNDRGFNCAHNTPIKLTRKTLCAIILRTNNHKAAQDNPQEFALHAAKIIREKAIEQLVAGIQYSKDGTWYDMSEWIEEEETVSDRLIPVDNSIYDHIVVQSETEKRFVEKLKKRSDVRLFVKLPGMVQGCDTSGPIQS